MSGSEVQRRLSAILSADVEGYSRLMGQDEAQTVRTLTAYRQAMAEIIALRRGRVVDSPGDNLLAEFGSVVDAVQCGVEVQCELRLRNERLPEGRRMAFRIGINLGDVIVEGERIYGDGVNIAARLEGLAQGGGICVSGTVFDQVEGKLQCRYEFLGEQTVKNIAKPVRVYRVWAPGLTTERGTDPASHGVNWRRHLAAVMAVAILFVGAVWLIRKVFYEPQPSSATSPPAQALALPDRPSIAVLPFVNLGGEPDEDYFSDGMTEDLITDLSRISGMFVISRNSVFTYKGKAVKPELVSRELGVRYVIEGSVRRAGERLRVTAQLIDATTGGHLWADRYDREMNEIFALQDEIRQQILTALKVKVMEAEQERVLRKGSRDLKAYDYALRGRSLHFRFTREANAEAQRMYEKAIEMDPNLAGAYAGLGWTLFHAWVSQWSEEPGILDRSLALAQRALAIDGSLALAHCLQGVVFLWKRQFDLAVAEKERAVALDPNDADLQADLAETMVWTGRPQEAIPLVEKAIRLNPYFPVHYLFTLGYAQLLTGQHEKAESSLRQGLARNPNFMGIHVVLAVLYAEAGRIEDAGAQVQEIARISPRFSLDVAAERLPFKDPALLERTLIALRKAGLT